MGSSLVGPDAHRALVLKPRVTVYSSPWRWSHAQRQLELSRCTRYLRAKGDFAFSKSQAHLYEFINLL